MKLATIGEGFKICYDGYKESATMEVSGEMCQRHMSWENSTHSKRNPLQQRHRVKCAQGIQAKTT